MLTLTPRTTPCVSGVVFHNVFTEQELADLQSMADGANEKGNIVSIGNADDLADVRRSYVRWLNFELATQVYFEKIGAFVSEVNAHHFRFDLTCLGEQLQLSRYVAEEKGHYGWHQDFNFTISRKLSITVQLSSPDDYEGGDLEILKADSTVFTADRTRGAVVVFPAFQLHRVTPVTRGARCSLVTWISGPPFR